MVHWILFFAMNAVWICVTLWINKSWYEEYRRMNREWCDFAERQIKSLKERAKWQD